MPPFLLILIPTAKPLLIKGQLLKLRFPVQAMGMYLKLLYLCPVPLIPILYSVIGDVFMLAHCTS